MKKDEKNVELSNLCHVHLLFYKLQVCIEKK